MNRCFFTLLTVILGVFYSTNPASAIKTKSLSPDNTKNLYQVTCDNGKHHTIIANHGEHDFQYYYPNKGYYIKYYDIEFKDLYDFAEWVCRNKEYTFPLDIFTQNEVADWQDCGKLSIL